MDTTKKLTFEEIMFSVIVATQETCKAYMDMEIYAGQVRETLDAISADVIGIVGIAGERVGYMFVAMDYENGEKVAKRLLMMDESPSEDDIQDAVGELANNIAGFIKSKYHEQYGKVDLGLPLMMAGRVTPRGNAESVEVKSSGVIIPFRSFDPEISFKVGVYM